MATHTKKKSGVFKGGVNKRLVMTYPVPKKKPKRKAKKAKGY